VSFFDSVRNFLSRRRTAYIQTFQPNGPLAPFAQEVLADLARFCRANKSCFHKDPRAHAVAEGRREVWLRIQNYLQLTDEQLWALYDAGQPANPRSNEDA
jgi:hypothetical protein